MKLIHRELVFKIIEQLGWSIQPDPCTDYFPEIGAICDADEKIIWVNTNATLDNQIMGALYLTLWPGDTRADFRPEVIKNLLFFDKEKITVVQTVLSVIFATDIENKRQKVR